MAPSGRTATTNTKTTSRTKAATTTTTTKTTTRTTRRRTRQQRRTAHNKKQEVPTVLPSTCSSKGSSEEGDMEMNVCEVIDVPINSACCSTPKGQKFRIPEISTCPPAPKKPRVLSNCSLRRSPLSFFTPPDLELFFFSVRDVSV